MIKWIKALWYKIFNAKKQEVVINITFHSRENIQVDKKRTDIPNDKYNHHFDISNKRPQNTRDKRDDYKRKAEYPATPGEVYKAPQPIVKKKYYSTRPKKNT